LVFNSVDKNGSGKIAAAEIMVIFIPSNRFNSISGSFEEHIRGLLAREEFKYLDILLR
jgi:hypothetical protein